MALEGPADLSRHGLAEFENPEFLSMLEQVFCQSICHPISVALMYTDMYFNDKRHESCGNPRCAQEGSLTTDWRMRERMKTFSAALVTCLNIGTDPPDIVKTIPCAKTECWIDPFSLPVQKALDQIGKNLQQQYETLSMRTRYKVYGDPSVEEIKKFCSGQRRNAKDERVLFHYNGHGVPKPTQSGEIWVFNKTYTQYIPVSLYDLQSWLGSPCLYVFDCSAAGNILTNFLRFAEQKDTESLRSTKEDGDYVPSAAQKESIVLAACTANEILPMTPELPADLFTCCLTSPIEIAVRWFVLQNPLPSPLTLDMVTKIPGRLQDRRTALGELNWIFTAITDTIAWNVLPGPLFKRLFRQDLMVAALFRNFLLAERIMRTHQCHPLSYPVLPATHNHPMWDSWDLAVDTCLAQLPDLLKPSIKTGTAGEPASEQEKSDRYVPSTFFTEQLLAFEVWLQTGSASKKAPDQLPIVLQVLLSQAHRLRALILLSKFLDLGPWAVNLALSIGIFPYVLKLLQSPAMDLKPVLIFIWARILAVDGSCQVDLLKDNGYNYFVQILLGDDANIATATNPEESRAMCAFILAIFCKDHKQGQICLLSTSGIVKQLLEKSAGQYKAHDPILRQWSLLLISSIWKDFPEAKWQAIREHAPEKIVDALQDIIPEVRASALTAITSLFGLDFDEQVIVTEEFLATSSLALSGDGSALVRKELVAFMSGFVARYERKFVVTVFEGLLEEFSLIFPDDQVNKDRIAKDSVYSAVWRVLLMFTVDPFPEVEAAAIAVVDHCSTILMRSVLKDKVLVLLSKMYPQKPNIAPPQAKLSASRADDDSKSVHTLIDVSKKSSMRNTLKRTASIAVSLKNFAMGYSDDVHEFPSEPNQPPADITYVPSIPQVPLYKPMPRGSRKVKYSAIPIPSQFLAWSTEYFTEPQMKPAESDEPGSLDYNERLWRRTRNEKIISDTQAQKEIAGSHEWSYHMAHYNNISQPTRLIFHQFESHLVSVDDKDGVCVWDWEENRKLAMFSNGNPAQSKVTELKFLNEDDVALLMTGSSDGVVRLYRNYESEEVELVSSWRALSDLLPSSRSSGLVADWQQGRGTLLVGGDVKIIRVWDAPREMCQADIPARSGSCITSLTSDQVAGDIFIAGFGDGAVRVYDRRLPPREAMIKVWKEHKAWVSNVHMQRGGQRELISGCVTGEVKLWDLRLNHAVSEVQAHTGGLRSLAVHEHAPVFATGSTNHTLNIWNSNSSCLSSIRHSSGFLQQGKSSSISALAFHPHRMILASSGANQSIINLDSIPGL